MPPRARTTENGTAASVSDDTFGAPAAVEISAQSAGRKSLIDKYPKLLAAVEQSWKSGQGYAYGPFPTPDEANRVQALIRLAGRKLGCGFSPLRVTDDNRVEFKAKDKRSYAGAAS